MADAKKKGFKTLESNYDEIDEKIREHRMTIMKRVVKGLAVLLVLAVLLELFYALRSFEDYEVRDSVERGSSGVTQYEMFGDNLLEYSNYIKRIRC